MRGTRYLGFVAAAATVLAAAPLSTIFDRWTWLIQAIIAVAAVYGAATLVRSLRMPVWVQVVGMSAALLLALTWMFPSGGEWLALVPTAATVQHFGALASGSLTDMREYGIPVPDTDPLLFITVLGVGAVGVVVDVLTVGLRRPALAGLPMLAIYSVPVAVYTDSVPPVPFVIGAAGFIWLLVADNVDRVRRFGRRFTGDGRDVSVWEPSPLSAAGRRLAVVGLVLAVLLPLTVPGMTTGLLSGYNSAAGEGDGPGQGGAPGRVNLFASLSGQLNQAEVRDLVKVTTTETEPFYLRFGVADELQSDGFRVRSPKGTPITKGLPPTSTADGDGITRRTFPATVEITRDFNMPLLPVYSDPVSVRGLDSSWLFDPDLQVLYSNRSQSRGRKYSFEYVRSTYTPAALAAAPALARDDPMRQFSAVPDVKQVTDLVKRLTDGKRSGYAKVRAIYDYFSIDNGFTYSLTTEGGTSGEDIVDFLDNKRGFCQQYAAAMAWLVRAAGIPARVAFGFTNGSDRENGAYVLTNHNLHAWTEVYFNGAGWVPFDATPAGSVAGSTRSAWAPDSDAIAPSAPSTGASAGPDSSAAAVPGADRPDRDPDAGLSQDGAQPVRSAPTWPWWTAAGVALLILLLALPALRRLLLRRRRSRLVAGGATVLTAVDPAGRPGVVVSAGDPDRVRADAHAAWDELLDTMVDFKVRVDPTETPRGTADRLAADWLTGPAIEAVQLLGRAEERARYARDPLQDGPLAPALRSVRRSLVADVGWRTRLTAAVLPPSVLLRWRMALVDGYARGVGSVGRRRDGWVRWSPWRLVASRTGQR